MTKRTYPVPVDETQRQRALERYEILDSSPERFYDDVSTVAALICGTPMAMVSLIDRDRQWFKSAVGTDTTETARKDAFCAHTIMTPTAPLIVTDASRDERFKDSALVLQDPHIRFYAGAPLVTPEGQPLGALCVVDTKPRELALTQVAALEALTRSVAAHLEQRRHIANLEHAILARDAHLETLEDQRRALEMISSRYKQESLVDAVTRGPNRRAYEMRLLDEHDRAVRYGVPYALVMIDLDHFKDVNDLHGHSKGDEVLDLAAHLLRTSVRPSDFVARLGGDEFVAVLPHTDPRSALLIAERMRRTLYNASWKTSVPITASIGVGCWRDKSDAAESVFARADEALYVSKKAGRNVVSGPHNSLA